MGGERGEIILAEKREGEERKWEREEEWMMKVLKMKRLKRRLAKMECEWREG